MKQNIWLFLIMLCLSCSTNSKKNITVTPIIDQSVNANVNKNDTIEKVKAIIDISNAVAIFDSLPDNTIIYPKKYFNTTQTGYLIDSLKRPIPMCQLFNNWENTTSSILNGTHLLKIRTKGNFEIAYLHSPDAAENMEIYNGNIKDRPDSLLLSATIIIFTNYPLICHDSLFVGVQSLSARIPVLKNIKVGDNFKTLFRKLGYSYLKSENIIFYHDWKNTIAKFTIKDDKIDKIAVVRYNISLLNDTLPSFIMNTDFISEQKSKK